MTLTKLIGQLIKPLSWRTYYLQRERALSAHIPYTHFVTPFIMATKNNDWCSVFKIKGIPFNVSDETTLAYLQQQLSFLIQQLGADYAWYVTLHREHETIPTRTPPLHAFSRQLDDAYHATLFTTPRLINTYYLTVIHREQSIVQKQPSWFTRINTFQAALGERQAQRLQQFEQTLLQIQTSLTDYQPTRLGDDDTTQSALLEFLSLFINGERQNFIYPYSSIAHYVPRKRLYIGHDSFHLEGALNDHRYGAVLSVKAYSPTTTLGMFNALLGLPFEFIATHSFLPMHKLRALHHVTQLSRRFISTNDPAHSQIDALFNVKERIASDELMLGWHHHTITLLASDLNQLNESIANVVQLVQAQGISLVRETLNLENAFWAQLPANFNYIKRHAIVSQENLTSYCSFYDEYRGFKHKTHLGEALLLCETLNQHVFYFNLHEQASGRRDDLSKGHTLIIGPSNAGKTVILTMLDAMMKRFHARSFFIDRNGGVEVYVRAMGGTYCRLVPQQPTHWNPLQLAETPENKAFLIDFLSILSREDGALSADDKTLIADVVERIYTLPQRQRRLECIVPFFPPSFSGLSSLMRYATGDKAYLFNNEIDCLTLDTHTFGIDMTHWLGSNQSTHESEAIHFYLFHRITQSLDGTLTGLYLDEAWQCLYQSYWLEKLNEFLVTWRKRNAFIVFATQLPDKVAHSPLASALIQGTATHIFLANPKAQHADYCQHFKLSEKEFDIVRTLPMQSRYFLMKQHQQSAIVRFNVEHLIPYLKVLSGTQHTINQCEELRAIYGDAPEQWLPAFMHGGLHE